MATTKKPAKPTNKDKAVAKDTFVQNVAGGDTASNVELNKAPAENEALVSYKDPSQVVPPRTRDGLALQQPLTAAPIVPAVAPVVAGPDGLLPQTVDQQAPAIVERLGGITSPSQEELAAIVRKTQKGKVTFHTKSKDADSIYANGKEYAPAWDNGTAYYTVNEEDADAFSKHTHVAHGRITRTK